MICSLTGTGSTGSFGFFSLGSEGLASFLTAAAAFPLVLGGLLDDRDTFDATELERARRGVDLRGVVARRGVEVELDDEGAILMRY